MSNYTIGTDKYTKIVYQTNPIGPEKIILYLTTFDIEKFKEDESLKKCLQNKLGKNLKFLI